jgi:hypothetical protein
MRSGKTVDCPEWRSLQRSRSAERTAGSPRVSRRGAALRHRLIQATYRVRRTAELRLQTSRDRNAASTPPGNPFHCSLAGPKKRATPLSASPDYTPRRPTTKAFFPQVCQIPEEGDDLPQPRLNEGPGTRGSVVAEEDFRKAAMRSSGRRRSLPGRARRAAPWTSRRGGGGIDGPHPTRLRSSAVPTCIGDLRLPGFSWEKNFLYRNTLITTVGMLLPPRKTPAVAASSASS